MFKAFFYSILVLLSACEPLHAQSLPRLTGANTAVNVTSIAHIVSMARVTTFPFLRDPNREYIVLISSEESLTTDSGHVNTQLDLFTSNGRPRVDLEETPSSLVDHGPSHAYGVQQVTRIERDDVVGVALYYGSQTSPDQTRFRAMLGSGLRLNLDIVQTEVSVGLRLSTDDYGSVGSLIRNSPLGALMHLNQGVLVASTTNIRVLELPRNTVSLFARLQVNSDRDSSRPAVLGLLGFRIDTRQ